MDWTEREITIAKQLSDKDTLAFMRKVFVELHTDQGEVYKKNIAALDDAEYGRVMKVLYLTKEENKAKLNLIQRVSKMKKGEQKQTPIAPH